MILCPFAWRNIYKLFGLIADQINIRKTWIKGVGFSGNDVTAIGCLLDLVSIIIIVATKGMLPFIYKGAIIRTKNPKENYTECGHKK